MKKGKQAFIPKARLIQILGEQLIKDATVGLLELVKNCYDADATNVQVVMITLNTPEAKIIIRDNGCGMDSNTFLDKWMNPASGHKEKQKREKKRTPLGRLPLGEKGVGRFAAQQIGDRLRLVSRTENSGTDLLVNIDWKRFEGMEQDLSEVEIEYVETETGEFKPNESGTLLEISELKSNWTETDIKRVANTLKRMKSPFKGATDFDVTLKFKNCPEKFSKYEKLEISDILNKAHYKLFGIVDEKGGLEFEYDFFVPGYEKNHKEGKLNLFEEFKLETLENSANFKLTKQSLENLRDEGVPDKILKKLKILENQEVTRKNMFLNTVKKQIGIDQTDKYKQLILKHARNLVCGGIIINLHNYDKSTEWKWLQKSNVAKRDIEELCGVSVYRDGIRILPYGEKGDDWLELDKRRIQVPTKRVGNDTIIGMVEINQIENHLLKDKTNREGLIENTAFHQFRELVLTTIQVLENERWDDRPERKKKREQPESDLNRSIKEVKSSLSGITKQLSKSSDEKTSRVIPLIEEATQKVKEIEEGVIQSVEDQKQEKEILFNLAGTGLAAERFTHEFARLVSGANDALQRLKKLLKDPHPKVKKEIDTIYGALEALRNDIRLLGPMFYVRKVAREKELEIRQIIENTVLLQDRQLKKESIDVRITGDSFSVTMREGSCMQIFNNLIDNSVYWLSRKSELDKRKIRIILDANHSSVFISDSGSGVTPRYRDKIFEPFFSTKVADGRGLGLYIAKEILEEKSWDITLVSQDDYPELELLQGASFKITFSENKNG